MCCVGLSRTFAERLIYPQMGPLKDPEQQNPPILLLAVKVDSGHCPGEDQREASVEDRDQEGLAVLRVLMRCDGARTPVVTLQVAKQRVKQILVPQATSHPSTCATQPGFFS